MPNSTHNPDSSTSGNLKPALKRAVRKLLPPPGANLTPQDLAELVQGDNLDEQQDLLTRACNLSNRADGFHPPLCQWLAAESLEYNRARRFRAAARNQQIEDDREFLANTFEQVDDEFRQYHAETQIVANPSQRLIRRDGEGSFRRVMRLHDTILKTARLAPK